MTDRERFELMRAKAAKRRAEAPDYPDTPEQIADQRETHDFMMALQSKVLYDLPPDPDGLLRERIATWLQLNPRQALEVAADAAQRQIPGHLGTCVSAVLWDHSGDTEPDPNINELAHTLLFRESRND